MISLQALLSSPEPDIPMDYEAAKMYKHDRQMFEQTVKMWVEAFASDYQIDQKIKQLTDMGFDEETSIKTL